MTLDTETTLRDHLQRAGRISAAKRTPEQRLEYAAAAAVTRKAKSERCQCGKFTLKCALQRWPARGGQCKFCVATVQSLHN